MGFNKKGSTFWLFDDNRLYKETPKPKVSRKKKPAPKKGKRAPPPPPPPTSNRRSSRRNQPVVEEKPAEPEQEEDSEDEGEWVPWKLVCNYSHCKRNDRLLPSLLFTQHVSLFFLSSLDMFNENRLGANPIEIRQQ